MNSDIESWLPVSEYEGLYEVSNLGRVRSLPRNGTLGGILAANPVRGGYLTVHLSKGNKQRRLLVSRLVATAFHGPCPDGLECAHLNGKRDDNRSRNLEWTTPVVNQGHRRIHGTTCEGERGGFTKLTAEKVLAIRRLQAIAVGHWSRRANGTMSQQEVADRFGISRQLVSAIWNRKVWRHLP